MHFYNVSSCTSLLSVAFPLWTVAFGQVHLRHGLSLLALGPPVDALVLDGHDGAKFIWRLEEVSNGVGMFETCCRLVTSPLFLWHVTTFNLLPKSEGN